MGRGSVQPSKGRLVQVVILEKTWRGVNEHRAESVAEGFRFANCITVAGRSETGNIRLRYAREIVERGPEKLGHAVRTSDIGVAGTKSPEHKRRGSDILFK